MRVYLNLRELLDYTSDSAFVLFVNMTNISQVDEDYNPDVLSQIKIGYENGSHYAIGYDEDGVELWSKTDINILGISDNSTYIEFSAVLSSQSNILKLIDADVLSFPNQTLLYAYKQNSENDNLTKTLTFVTIVVGEFNHSIGVKNLNIDMQDFANSFNYVFIPSLNRYYYVDSIEIISADITRLHLKEDVLMSWKSLIKQQSAFITRYENSTNIKIVDERYPLEDKLTTLYITPVQSTSPLTNTTLNFAPDNSKFKILVSSISDDLAQKHDVSAPTGTSLPSFTSLQSKNERNAFITFEQLSYLLGAVIDDDAIMSFINSVILLPFDPESVYTNASTDGFIDYVVIANDKYLCDDYKFHKYEDIPVGVSVVSTKGTTADASPYFIIADFTLTASTLFENCFDYEPYTTWEIYVPFVGWVKVNAEQCLGKRLLIYYTLDYKTGMGTAYIYNRTSNVLIWSSSCQLGIKLDLTTTNAAEIARQKQANELNMILGLVASAVSIGVGVASENPVAVVGGVLSASKTIASNVNANNMLFERAQTSFGTSEGVFHTPNNVMVRRTYHASYMNSLTTYKHMQGLPYKNYVTDMSALSGYVEVGEIHFDPKNNIIYQDEITEIIDLLQKGVIF